MKKKIISLVFVLIIGSGIFVGRYVYLNKKYPPPTLIKYSLNQEFDYYGCKAMISDYSFVEKSEIVSKGYLENQPLTNGDMLMLTIRMKIRNDTNQTQKIEIYPLQMESASWWNGIDAELFNLVKESDVNLYFELLPNSQKQFTIPFMLYDVQFAPRKWKNVKDDNYNLVLSLYPQKRTISVK